ncbi:hypothetical protein [Thioclava electrotropha]|uniref:Transferrin-binding protein B C-lobe/N-lobe beta barrel domain-containing protein n=1 Tax=Thioclava electrotropha TaxID=1549850 RepID=A0ABX6Z054_9RHOB|nr:hypothetical protein [Thioclava electrotropha]QPZ92863.1 hypothetical protein AKL02_019475 [Thioclava electrotropha]
MTFKFALAASAACLALAACNSSNGSSAALTSAEAQNVEATYSDYADRIGTGDLTTTVPTGQASMSGYMGVSNVNPDDPTTTVMGELAMDVDFDAGTLTGKGSNFGIYSGDVLTKEADVTGSLDVAGTVSSSDMTATATGTMSDGSSAGADFALDMTGSFYDDAGTLTAVGDISGTMTDGSDVQNVDGNYYATEN